MNYLSFSIHGNADGHNELLEMLTGLLGFLEGLTANGGSSNGSNFLEGIASLANIHPLLVHFPIAFLSLFVAIDLIGTATKKSELRKFAGNLLYLGTAFAALTVWAGFHAAETVPHGHNVHDIMERHEHLGISILGLSLALSAWRLRRPVEGWGIYNVLSVILAGVLIAGADLGGLMVYKYGVAVEAVTVSPEDSHHHE
ncbi:MAG: DUF2231 domain-containing protein [Methylococcales bacterium]|nr:DUF2231 domain-containing protein [Methylococcales bacterium]